MEEKDNNIKETKIDLNYYYIKPVLNIPNLSLILIIIAFFCYLILHWNFVYSNWENEKCNNSNFFLAPIFGKNSATTLQQCTSDLINKSVDESLQHINIENKMIDMSNNITTIMNNVIKAKENGGTTVGNTMNSASTIITGIQSNIDNIKTALTKVLGSVVLSSYMSNGIIQSTQSLENTDLMNMVKEYGAVNNAILTREANPPPSQ